MKRIYKREALTGNCLSPFLNSHMKSVFNLCVLISVTLAVSILIPFPGNISYFAAKTNVKSQETGLMKSLSIFFFLSFYVRQDATYTQT